MRVAVLMVAGMFDSGLATVCDVLGAANAMRDQIERPPPAWEVTVVGSRRHLRTAAGHRVTTTPMDALEHPPDVLVAPALGLRGPDELIDTVRSARRTVALIAAARSAGVDLAAACSGTFFLGEAGVLDEHDATTSWWLGSLFRARYPKVRLDTGATLVAGDGISTAGAAFAHIDLALSLVARHSPAVADLVTRYLLIGDRASQASFAVPTVMARHHPDMARFEQWVRGHLTEPVRVADAAAAIGLSERSLQRVTSSSVGMTPIEFLNEVRLDEAAYLLRSTQLTADAVAARVGFRNAGTLRSLVRRRRGVTLSSLRRG
jgi:transcriptional regulator GlxA family with amidase domain